VSAPVALYNEIDPYCAQWLRNLIDAGHIAPGVVDERSIEDITPDELREYTQVHCFAGIGVWSYALRLAGWPDDRPVWTGSCPCQPFSAAGKGAGFADERHLWPAWQHLISQCRPPIVLGEQVASKHADAWIDLVHADMEGMGYAFGCVPFPAAGIGAPHIRDRNYWVAHAYGERSAAWLSAAAGRHERIAGVADHGGGEHARPGFGYAARRLADANGRDTSAEREQRGREQRQQPADGRSIYMPYASTANSLWRDADWLKCRDGRWRPVEPGTFPLAHGIANRVGRLRAYGNAINAEAAAAVVRAYIESREAIAESEVA
jgi:DNA (cytosine-5)-methyltransferase 1